MGFIKFVFVLLIVVPIAVLMIYLVNNLNEKIKTSREVTEVRRSLKIKLSKKAESLTRNMNRSNIRENELKAGSDTQGLNNITNTERLLIMKSISVKHLITKNNRRKKLIMQEMGSSLQNL